MRVDRFSCIPLSDVMVIGIWNSYVGSLVLFHPSLLNSLTHSLTHSGTTKHSDIDEAVFPAQMSPHHLPRNPIPVAAPVIPSSNPLHHHNLGESNLDGHILHQLHHQVAPGTPYTITDNYPDGDFTTATDVTYTTDDASVVTTSVPPSSVGSPNIHRRGDEPPVRLPQSPDHFQRSSSSRATENNYVDMQPLYASIKRDHRHDSRHHQQQYQEQQPMDYRSAKAYERRSRERSERLHDQSRETSHDRLSEPDYARSPSPTSPTGKEFHYVHNYDIEHS